MRSAHAAVCLIAHVFLADTAGLAESAPADVPSSAGTLAACGRELDGEKRLACYDALARRSPAVSEAPRPDDNRVVIRTADGAPSMVGSWIVRREIDTLTDKPRVFVSNASEGRGLQVRCFDGRLEVVYSPNTYLGGRDGSVPVWVRFGAMAAVSQAWTASTTGNAAFSRNPREFVAAMETVDRVVVEAADFRGSRYRTEFDVGGFAVLASQIAPCRQAAARPPQRR